MGLPFKADQAPASAEPYGVSKYETEKCLREIELQIGVEVVSIMTS